MIRSRIWTASSFHSENPRSPPPALPRRLLLNTASQLPLLNRLNGLVTELDNMVKLAEKCNIQIPMEVLNLIGDGKNPDEFTRDVINNFIAKSQVTKGKTEAFKGLRKHLLEDLEQTFPDEVESYREIRALSAVESKRLAQSQSSLPNGKMNYRRYTIMNQVFLRQSFAM